MFIFTCGSPYANNIGMYTINIDPLIVFIACCKTDDTPSTTSPFSSSFGDSSNFIRTQCKLTVNRPPRATDNICAVFDTVVKHGFGAFDTETCTRQRHQTSRRSCPTHTAILRSDSHTGARCAVREIRVALSKIGCIVPQIPRFDDFRIQIGVCRINAVVNNSDHDVWTAITIQQTPCL